MVALTVLLTVVGILVFFSASLSLLPKGASVFGTALVTQVVLGLGLGGGVLYALTRLPLQLLKKYALHIFVGSLVVTAAVFIPHLGVTANGATRWLNLGFITVQPSEILKIGYVLLIAALLSNGRERGADLRHGILPFALISVLVGVLLLLQPDTDTLIVTIGAGVAMLFASGLKTRDVAIGAVLAIVGLTILVTARPYLTERVLTFIDPSRDSLGSGYHIQQSLITVGSGELLGRGYGQSIQKFDKLPEASSDAIFAVFAEEFGFVGSVLLVFLYLCFVLRGMWVSARAHDLFGGLLALGLVTVIGMGAFLNIASMIGLVPVGGLALPFVSRGGTALLVTLAMAGLILAVSRTVRTQ